MLSAKCQPYHSALSVLKIEIHVHTNIKPIDHCMCRVLILKWLETHECGLSTVATDALVLKHQAISICSVD